MRKPDAICIGAQKAGTSWLFNMMADRPDVWTPPMKELHFFDHHYVDPPFPWTDWHVKTEIRSAIRNHVNNNPQLNIGYIKYLSKVGTERVFTERWYEHVFSRAKPHQLAFEATPEYSTIGEDGVDFVKSYLPDTRFIYILRHPVDRAVSQIRMHMMRRKLSPKTATEWQALVDAPEIMQRGRISEYVPRWRARFGPDRLMITDYAEMRQNPEVFMRDVEDFLGLSRFDYPRLTARIHRTKAASVPETVRQRLRRKLAEDIAFYEGETAPAGSAVAAGVMP